MAAFRLCENSAWVQSMVHWFTSGKQLDAVLAAQVVDFGDSGPIRCGRCRAYINPFMRFEDGGRQYKCVFCGAQNECPSHYFSYLGPDGRRRDAGERPELSRGSVEFAAPQQFMVRDPMPVVHFFLIDVSCTAIETGATAACCRTIGKVLDNIQGGLHVVLHLPLCTSPE